jgi:uncharacterized membrane protein HdeD (DUF308 family)
VTEAFRAFSSARASPVIGHLLMSLIDIAAGVTAIAWPGPTAFVLVIVVAAWAIVAGIAEFAAGFAAGETAGPRAMFLFGGLVSVAFGVVLFARPGIGALTLALLFGLFALIYGISQISLGVRLRSAGNVNHSAMGA